LTEICQTAKLDEMQTTLRFDEALMRRAKAEAAHQGMSLTRFIEIALRERLRNQHRPAKRQAHRKFKLPVSRARGGFAPGISDLKAARAITDNDIVVDRFLAPKHFER
jgi:hypothetical protein